MCRHGPGAAPKDAPWLADFLTELLSFPAGLHDDQVDSVSQFLHWFQQSAFQRVPIVARRSASRPQRQRSNQSRQKARTLQHCTDGEAGDKEEPQEGPQSQKAMTALSWPVWDDTPVPSKWDAG
jgi:hypothetical protein